MIVTHEGGVVVRFIDRDEDDETVHVADPLPDGRFRVRGVDRWTYAADELEFGVIR
ncbi:hypothetical protein [Rhodococcus sp. 06-418-5]|uniref:hypothetical protein n=1 Tax=Rhodococcus sp. 06-418-5 TaxID=2022507 RepID=UPI0015C5FC28|nr:hypothetical protein [Rhodococcus sp. 06-418-5]